MNIKEEINATILSLYEMIDTIEFKEDSTGFKPEKRALENRIYSLSRLIELM